MTFPRLEALQAYWQRFPPVHVLVAGAVGYKAPPSATPAKLGRLEDLLELFPGGVIRG
jgi:hypothetical protein